MVERRINKSIENYLTEFKDNIRQKTTELGIKSDELIQYIYTYIYIYETYTKGLYCK